MELHIKAKIMTVHQKMDVLDVDENPVYHVGSKMISITDKTDVVKADGTFVAHIHRKPVSIHDVYYVEMADGAEFELREELLHMSDHIDIDALGWKLVGHFPGFNYELFGADGSLIARAHVKVASIHQIYYIDVIDEAHADEIVCLFVILHHIVSQRGASAAAASSSSN
ncbi:MAG: LURP-one-related family protein [Atopobiaceae bacterium]|jgi:uncharacterized protein YxjI|nr:LURP-one-related family protein [Atopobiaceae bacterium]MCI2173398.1 LURP-one-related family protein [Atopobiaceae bacterium]MCI2207393.1 LURP-one-related family protein [Atopobiaceae bacterium]